MHFHDKNSSEEISSEDLSKKLNQIYNDLLENSIDFDPEFSGILYNNLWELYDD